MTLLLAGCASQPSYYTTQLDTTGGLGPGDPITHASATIGHVTGVTPISDGDSEIAFEVDGSHVDEIHYDSIMTLNNLGATPSLDVLNVDAMSHSAPSGTRLDGASSMNEVQMFMTARGPGSFAQALGNVAGPTTSTPPSASTVQMTQMLAQISQQTLASAVAIAPPTKDQLDQAKHEAQGVERQLMRNGKIEQAERLRASMGSMMGGVTAPANPSALPPTSPNP
jgi:MlaD protein